ncbi:hypothetical protein [Ureibacillus manganicus]|nr:hypothetical protein [Ureibacillus manganicus]
MLLNRPDFVEQIQDVLQNRYADVKLRSLFVRAPPRDNIIT